MCFSKEKQKSEVCSYVPVTRLTVWNSPGKTRILYGCPQCGEIMSWGTDLNGVITQLKNRRVNQNVKTPIKEVI